MPVGLRDHLCSRRGTIMPGPRAWSTVRRCCSTSTGCPPRGLSGWPTDETARACPACGVFATRVKGSAVTRPRDLPYGESGLESRRHKRRWWCREAGCRAGPSRSRCRRFRPVPG
ncbi:transposase family protein [Streptomyces sp. NPDC092296]|uniref:transposase family protein n=1 Tax=Streptomyces sp. NPDC092296 TaxID=3366012 RepID=UPI00382606A1